MAQYLLSVHHGDDNALPEGADMNEIFAAVDAFNQRLIADGAMVFAGGMLPASSATVVHASGETTPGPYLTGEEYLGGFWVIEAPDEAAALDYARAAVATRCSRTIEVRPFQG